VIAEQVDVELPAAAQEADDLRRAGIGRDDVSGSFARISRSRPRDPNA